MTTNKNLKAYFEALKAAKEAAKKHLDLCEKRLDETNVIFKDTVRFYKAITPAQEALKNNIEYKKLNDEATKNNNKYCIESAAAVILKNAIDLLINNEVITAVKENAATLDNVPAHYKKVDKVLTPVIKEKLGCKYVYINAAYGTILKITVSFENGFENTTSLFYDNNGTFRKDKIESLKLHTVIDLKDVNKAAAQFIKDRETVLKIKEETEKKIETYTSKYNNLGLSDYIDTPYTHATKHF